MFLLSTLLYEQHSKLEDTDKLNILCLNILYKHYILKSKLDGYINPSISRQCITLNITNVLFINIQI